MKTVKELFWVYMFNLLPLASLEDHGAANLHLSSEVCVWGKSEGAAYISLGCCLLSAAAAAAAAYWEQLSNTCQNGRLCRDNLCGQFPLILQAFYWDYLWSQQP